MICNLYSIFMDKQHWGDPENFRPERFLNEKNDIVNAERVIPFGFGNICTLRAGYSKIIGIPYGNILKL